MKSRIFYLLPILVVLSLALISAQTLIVGKIYNADYSDTIADADVHVVCSSSEPLNTISLNDGTYAVRFNETECNESDVVNVTASKSGFNAKTESVIISECEKGDCGGNYFIIINLGLEVKLPEDNDDSPHKKSPSKSKRYYLCGNGICDSGETINTCPQDCLCGNGICDSGETIHTCPQDCKQITKLADLNFEDGETIIIQEPEETKGFISRITGATVGAVTSTTGMVTMVFLIALVGTFVVARTLRKRNSPKRKAKLTLFVLAEFLIMNSAFFVYMTFQ